MEATVAEHAIRIRHDSEIRPAGLRELLGLALHLLYTEDVAGQFSVCVEMRGITSYIVFQHDDELAIDVFLDEYETEYPAVFDAATDEEAFAAYQRWCQHKMLSDLVLAAVA